MNLGTSYLALFFSYYCLTYCLVEDGSPAAALTGMLVFVVLSLIIVFMDTMPKASEVVILCGLQAVAPILSALAVWKSMPDGYGGIYEYVACVGQFTQGAWLLVYLRMLRVKETDTGVFCPMGFKTSLLLDSFGRHPHRSFKKWDPRYGRLPPSGTPDINSEFLRAQSPVRSSAKDLGSPGAEKQGAPLPSMTFVDGPFRPEDVSTNSVGVAMPDSWLPDSFFAPSSEQEEKGNICHGAKPGWQVWNIFRFAVCMMTLSWWLAGTCAFYEALIGDAHFKNIGLSWERKAENTHIVSVALQTSFSSWRSERIQTSWPSAMARPQGLACDPSGTTFATFGRGTGGRRALLHARVSEETAAPPRGYSSSKLVFLTAPACSDLEVEGKGQVVQDLALHKCADMTGCSALVLPKQGEALSPADWKATTSTSWMMQPLAWDFSSARRCTAGSTRMRRPQMWRRWSCRKY
jgi:hypothetical protein